MTTDTEEQKLTVDELAARAGVTVRTVRFYGTRGLLPPPVIGPRRVGHYGPEHLSRLALIEELQHQGMTLAAIERYLEQLPADLSAHDLAIHRAVVASWAPDSAEEMTRAELERRAGRPLSEEDLDRLTAMNVVARTAEAGAGAGAGVDTGTGADANTGTGADEATGTGADEAPAADAGTFRVDPGLLRLGVQLLDVPIAHETILAARRVLMEHTRAPARELSQLLHDEVSERESMAAAKSLSAHMQPLVVQALLTTFQRSLNEELRQWLKEP
jgi:DNA-binding transcriptional MerR regulator